MFLVSNPIINYVAYEAMKKYLLMRNKKSVARDVDAVLQARGMSDVSFMQLRQLLLQEDDGSEGQLPDLNFGQYMKAEDARRWREYLAQTSILFTSIDSRELQTLYWIKTH